MDLQSGNSVERMFIVVCLISGMLFSSSLTAAISASTIQYCKSKGDKTHKVMTPRRLLHQEGFNNKIGVRARNRQMTR